MGTFIRYADYILFLRSDSLLQFWPHAHIGITLERRLFNFTRLPTRYR